VAVQKLAFGNSKAGALLARIVSGMDTEAIGFMWEMGHLGLYGDSITYGFEQICHGDRDWFVACVLTSDPSFLREVEREKVRKAAEILNVDHLLDKKEA
jgi:hypothetical protein